MANHFTYRDDSAFEPRLPKNTFNLKSMLSIYKEAEGLADIPHKHDYYVVLLVKNADGLHHIDYQSYPFSAKQIHFISPGQIHQVAVESPPEGWVITFSRDFLIGNNISESFITNINLFKQYHESPPLLVDDLTFAKLERIIDDMTDCISPDLKYHKTALGALLQLFLIYCNNSKLIDKAFFEEEDSAIRLLSEFKQLVELHYREWHKVSNYAQVLNLSSKYLSFKIKSLTGKTAKEFLQDRLLLEAKRLLVHSDMNIKELGYFLGFEDPLHFSSFFKSKTKVSPSSFKKGKKT